MGLVRINRRAHPIDQSWRRSMVLPRRFQRLQTPAQFLQLLPQLRTLGQLGLDSVLLVGIQGAEQVA